MMYALWHFLGGKISVCKFVFPVADNILTQGVLCQVDIGPVRTQCLLRSGLDVQMIADELSGRL